MTCTVEKWPNYEISFEPFRGASIVRCTPLYFSIPLTSNTGNIHYWMNNVFSIVNIQRSINFRPGLQLSPGSKASPIFNGEHFDSREIRSLVASHRPMKILKYRKSWIFWSMKYQRSLDDIWIPLLSVTRCVLAFWNRLSLFSETETFPLFLHSLRTW